MKKVRKAVIPVAGFGTRFLPATKSMSKEMIPVIDKPVIQYIVEEVVASGVKQIIFITSHNKRAIEDHFDKSSELERLLEKKDKKKELEMVQEISRMANFVYVRQKEPLGLGHAILCAKELVGNDPFVVCLGDDIIDAKIPATKQLIKVYEKYRVPVIGVFEVPKDQTDRYGIIEPKKTLDNGAIQMKSIVEKPEPKKAPSNIAVGGRYVLTPDIFKALEETDFDKSGEIQLTNGIQLLMKKRRFFACKYEGAYHDCGNKLELLKTTIKFALRDKEISKDIKDYLLDEIC